MYDHWQPITAFELEARTHVGERLRYPLHRTPAQARVTLEARRKWVACHDAGQQARCCSTVSTVERVFWRVQSTKPEPLDSHLGAERRNPGAQCPKDLSR